MQSAKNRLEMAVSPQAKQTPPPEQPATDHSTHQAESTQEQNPCKTQDNWQLLASCPQNKTDSGTGDLSAWNDPEGQSSLCANPPGSGPTKGQGGDGVTVGRQHGSKQRSTEAGQGRASTGALQCPPRVQTAKGASTGSGLIRTLRNPALPPYVHSCSLWGLEYPAGWRRPLTTPCPHPQRGSAS